MSWNAFIRLSVLVLLFNCGFISAIRFSQGPQSTHVHKGEQATLRCAVDGKRIGNFVFWHLVERNTYISYDNYIYPDIRAGRYIIIGDHENGEFDLVVASVTVEDTGTYQCGFYFTNDTRNEFVFQEATVSLLNPPSIFYPQCSLSTGNMNPKPGDTVSIGCVSFGGTPPASLAWWKQDTMLIESMNSVSSLTHVLTPEDNGVEFICLATGLALSEPRSCKVLPMVIPPTVEVYMSDARPKLNDQLILYCVIDIIGPIQNIEWYWNGELIVKDSKSRLSVLMDGERIVIQRTQKSDNNTLVSCFVKTLSGLYANGSATITLSADQSIITTTQMVNIIHEPLPNAPSEGNNVVLPVILSVILILLALGFLKIFVKRSQHRTIHDGKGLNSIIKRPLDKEDSDGPKVQKKVTFVLPNLSPKQSPSNFARIIRMKKLAKKDPHITIYIDEDNDGFVENDGNSDTNLPRLNIQDCNNTDSDKTSTSFELQAITNADNLLDETHSVTSQVTDNTQNVTCADIET